MPIVSRTEIYGSFARLCTKPKVVICPMLTACFFTHFCVLIPVCALLEICIIPQNVWFLKNASITNKGEKSESEKWGIGTQYFTPFVQAPSERFNTHQKVRTPKQNLWGYTTQGVGAFSTPSLTNYRVKSLHTLMCFNQTFLTKYFAVGQF